MIHQLRILHKRFVLLRSLHPLLLPHPAPTIRHQRYSSFPLHELLLKNHLKIIVIGIGGLIVRSLTLLETNLEVVLRLAQFIE